MPRQTDTSGDLPRGAHDTAASTHFPPPPGAKGKPASKRRPRNFEGAFPLLLIGSALLVYCAVLRNEALTSNGVHFPLWGVVGAVGAVIAGAGVYSVFIDPSEPSEAAPEGFVMVPKAEWEATRTARRASPRSPSPTLAPPWWEGPEVYPETSQARPTRPTVPRSVARPAPVPPTRMMPRPRPVSPSAQRPVMGHSASPLAPRAPTRVAPPPPPTHPATRKTPLNELEAAISQLEALVDSDVKPGPRRPPKAGPEEPPSCADCGRGMASDWDPSRCSDCGRKLCVDCALASQFEDTDLRCIECRAREPRARRGVKTGPRRR